MKPLGIFISSVQREFAEERIALRDYLRGDPLMRRFYLDEARHHRADYSEPARLSNSASGMSKYSTTV